jgi:hypothetical protein
MLNKIKGVLLGFVKPLVLAHVSDLGLLAPMLSKVLVEKGNIPQVQADALAGDLVAVVETEVTTLINKI